MVTVLCGFIYLKQYTFLSFLPRLIEPYAVIGLSFILFRVIHLFIDCYEEAISEKIGFLSFWGFVTFFLAVISGPIQSFQDFQNDTKMIAREPVLSSGDVLGAFSRIVRGYWKIAVLSAIFSLIYHGFAMRIDSPKYSISFVPLCVFYIGALVTYPLYLYFNFSGYMDVVIGGGRLFGFNLPENFNRPFAATSFLELWSRWHMTLSSWFKSYIFNPLMKSLNRRWPDPKNISRFGVAAYFVTFLLMGIWHGTTLSFVIFGVLLAIGVSVNKLFENTVRAKLGKEQYLAFSENFFARFGGRVVTYGYFALALTCVWRTSSQIVWLAQRLGILGLVAIFVGSVIIVLCGMLVADGMMPFFRRLVPVVTPAISGRPMTRLWLAVQILLISAIVFSKTLSIPEFVYKAF